LGTDAAIQELNPNEIDITKVPSQFDIEDWYSFLYEDRAQPSQRVPQKRESKCLSEVLTVPSLANEYEFQETSTSRHNLFETNNLENNTHDDDNF
jgi:hypothetical protein